MLYYLSRRRLPGENEAIDDMGKRLKRAHAIQQMKMCDGFASVGEDVCFVSPKTAGEEPSWETVAEFYGLSSEFELKGAPSLSDDYRFPNYPVPNTDSATVTAWLIYSYLAGRFEEGDIIFSRSLHPTRHFLQFLDWIGGGEDISIWFAQHVIDRELDEYVIGDDFYEQLDRLVCVSERQKQQMIETHQIAPEKIFVAHDGVDMGSYEGISTAEAREQLGLDQDEEIVMYTGHLFPGKDVETLVEAAADFDAQCYIVGGYKEDISRIRSGVTVPDNVIFTGFQSPSDISLYQSAADVLVATVAEDPEKDYFSPLKIFEYMAAGKPIVVSRKPDYEEVLTDGENALLVEPGSASELATAIRELLADPELRTKLAEQGLKDVEQYGWNARAERILAEATEDEQNDRDTRQTTTLRKLTAPIEQLF